MGVKMYKSKLADGYSGVAPPVCEAVAHSGLAGNDASAESHLRVHVLQSENPYIHLHRHPREEFSRIVVLAYYSGKPACIRA